MQSFTYTIRDPLGIHARPAGMVVNETKKYASTITIRFGDKKASASRLMAVMALGVKCGHEVTVTAEGQDETLAIEGMRQFFDENL